MLKNKFNHFNKKYWQVALFLAAVFLFIFKPAIVYAQFFNDEETSRANEFSASSLDLGLSSDHGNFEDNSDWIPGSSAERTFKVSNEGDLKFLYGLKYESSDNSNLCGDIQLQVKYDGNEIYNDNLDDFAVSYDDSDPNFDHMMLAPGDSDHKYYFKIWLPIDSEDTANQNCQFDITAYAWQPNLDPYTGFWDEESLSNNIESTDFEEPQACELGSEIFMIGDKEASQEDNPVDELNWPGHFGEFPDFPNPFVIGTNTDDQFPWNSNYNQGEATDFDVKFFYTGEDALAKLTISWSPGKSGTEQKEVFLDGDSVGLTPNRNGVPVAGWWEDMSLFDDEFTFPLSHGLHTLNLQHLKGDGTLWDYVKLEIIGCSQEEGNVILNEIMWSGSTQSSNDEWIELYNDTDNEISMDYWTIENAGDGTDVTLPEGASIPAHGYYLISNFESDDPDSALSDSNITPDYVVDLNLDDGGEDLILKDAFSNEIDRVDASDGWSAGENGEVKKSMERNDNPNTGWHTCADSECNDTTYWDSEADNYGTPLAENKSDNDPSEQINAQLEGGISNSENQSATDSNMFTDTGIETDSSGDTADDVTPIDNSKPEKDSGEIDQAEEDVSSDPNDSQNGAQQEAITHENETTVSDAALEEPTGE